MKRVLCFILLWIAILGCSAEGAPFEGHKFYYYNDGIGNYSFEFQNGLFTLYDWQEIEDKKEEDSIPLPGNSELYCKFISSQYSVEKQDDYWVMTTKAGRYLVLTSGTDICVLIKIVTTPTENARMYWGTDEQNVSELSKKMLPVLTPEWSSMVITSSVLQGKTKYGIRYSPPFSRIYYDSTWVEGDIGDGKGQWISITIASNTDKILLLNGLTIPTSLKSYRDNSRAKVLAIEYNSEKQIVRIADTPTPIIIGIKQCQAGTKIKITILDVYPGSLYSDCAISFIGTLPVSFKMLGRTIDH